RPPLIRSLACDIIGHMEEFKPFQTQNLTPVRLKAIPKIDVRRIAGDNGNAVFGKFAAVKVSAKHKPSALPDSAARFAGSTRCPALPSCHAAMVAGWALAGPRVVHTPPRA